MTLATRPVVAALAAVALCTVVTGPIGTAEAAPVSGRFVDPVSGTRSTYEVVDDVLTWDQARAAASARTDPSTGCRGHLAAITSQKEQDFVTTRLPSTAGLWLGGERDEAGAFRWITGEPFDYAAWNDGQPDDYNGIEDKVQISFYDSSGRWNDISGSFTDGYTNGYVVEYQCVRPSVSSVAPASGPATGGTQVTITGSDFTGVKQVTFGGTPAASYTVDSPTQVTAVAPAYTRAVPRKGAVVPVRVQTTGGLSAKTPATRFTYAAAPATR